MLIFSRASITFVTIPPDQNTLLYLAVYLPVALTHLYRRHHRVRGHCGWPKLRDVKEIAIDEIHVGRLRRLANVVLAPKTGAVFVVVDSRRIAAPRPFWHRLRLPRANVAAVATDMAGGYIAAVQDFLPDAVHVFDRFHVMSRYYEKLSDLRQACKRALPHKLQKDVLKGIRSLLLMNSENLDPAKVKPRRLERALELNAPLATVYYMKELLQFLWERSSNLAAQKWLDEWIWLD